jgi:hypothetical protein
MNRKIHYARPNHTLSGGCAVPTTGQTLSRRRLRYLLQQPAHSLSDQLARQTMPKSVPMPHSLSRVGKTLHESMRAIFVALQLRREVEHRKTVPRAELFEPMLRVEEVAFVGRRADLAASCAARTSRDGKARS